MKRLESIEKLLQLIEEETGAHGGCIDEDDDSSVGWDVEGEELPMKFGHIRLARIDLEALKKERMN